MATTKVQLPSTASSLRGLVPHHPWHPLCALNWVYWEGHWRRGSLGQEAGEIGHGSCLCSCVLGK